MVNEQALKRLRTLTLHPKVPTPIRQDVSALLSSFDALKQNQRLDLTPEQASVRFAGHPSLADMVMGHIIHWRNCLKLELARGYDKLHGDEYQTHKSEIEHELRALDQIEKAVELELGL